jgi:hypothetical protein
MPYYETSSHTCYVCMAVFECGDFDHHGCSCTPDDAECNGCKLFVSPAVYAANEHSASGWSLEMARGMTPLASAEVETMPMPMAAPEEPEYPQIAATFPDGTPMAAPEEPEYPQIASIASTFPDGTPMAAPEEPEYPQIASTFPDGTPMAAPEEPVDVSNTWERYDGRYDLIKNTPTKTPTDTDEKRNPFSFSSNPFPNRDEYNPDDEKYYVSWKDVRPTNSAHDFTWARDLPPLSAVPFTRSPKDFYNSTPMASASDQKL